MLRKDINSHLPRYFGRRKGHALSKRRQMLIMDVLPRHSLVFDRNGRLNETASFGREGSLWLEIGFGAGEHLIDQALKNPNINFIGCEPFVNGVATLLSEIERYSIKNICIFSDDIRLLLKTLRRSSIDKVFLLFSDPWPKKRHNSRRLISSEMLDELSKIMSNKSKILVASDDLNLIRSVLNLFYCHQNFFWLADSKDDWENRYSGSIATRYENKAISIGKHCIYLSFTHEIKNYV
ncbi:MAG: tRNA (guanosine(46)-N7)-methyltransferase TrmB [Rhodospirillales bacterium]|tara:strand:+ start:50855 stop:51565 length:711 start_codon:yes stop_codon:yes gene_type:complete